jgi:Cu-Zn family superoxide dismutase
MISTFRCRLSVLTLLVIMTGFATACAPPAERPAAPAEGPAASAELQLPDGTNAGTVEFFAQPDGTRGQVELNVPQDRIAVNAYHGFHVHANDDPANGEGCIADPNADPSTWFTSADGHYRTEDQQHAMHLGDLPPLLVNRDGTASATFTTDRVTPQELVGRAVILHMDPDNLANVPVGTAPDQYTPNSPEALSATAATGNAGNRLACGVIR